MCKIKLLLKYRIVLLLTRPSSMGLLKHALSFSSMSLGDPISPNLDTEIPGEVVGWWGVLVSQAKVVSEERIKADCPPREESLECAAHRDSCSCPVCCVLAPRSK